MPDLNAAPHIPRLVLFQVYGYNGTHLPVGWGALSPDVRFPKLGAYEGP